MQTLTPAQMETLKAIEQFIAAENMAPTLRELMAILGLKSPCPVQSRIDGLIEAEAISIVPNKARTIQVLIPSEQWGIKAMQGVRR